jgi:hypothetical protein
MGRLLAVALALTAIVNHPSVATAAPTPPAPCPVLVAGSDGAYAARDTGGALAAIVAPGCPVATNGVEFGVLTVTKDRKVVLTFTARKVSCVVAGVRVLEDRTVQS